MFYVGYNRTFGGLDSLNYVIDRYNETRNFLDKEMKPFASLDGLMFGFAFAAKKFMSTVEFSWRGSKHSAWGVDGTGLLQQRDVKINYNALTMSFGYVMPSGNNYYSLGMYFDVGKFKARTRVAPQDQVKDEDWLKPVNELSMSVGAYFRIGIGSPGLYLEPYYNFGIIRLFRPDMAALNSAINPATNQNDPSQMLEKASFFGIKIGMQIGLD